MKKVVLGLLAALACSAAMAETLGKVNTAFKFTGSDHIVVEAYDDPKVAGVSCYVSRPKTGGISGTLGLAEDKSNASIDCVQTGAISFKEKLSVQEEVFSERLSVMFKKLRVVRVVDVNRNTLAYMTYSEKLIDGSPKTSVAAVVVPANLRIPLR